MASKAVVDAVESRLAANWNNDEFADVMPR
jgi:hypothetical protein